MNESEIEKIIEDKIHGSRLLKFILSIVIGVGALFLVASILVPVWIINQSSNNDPRLVMGVVSALTLITCLGIIGATVVSVTAFIKDADSTGKTYRTILQGGNALRILTVFVVILSVVSLALIDKLNQGVIAILSAVVGYVLGGWQTQKILPDTKNDESKT